MLGGMDTCHEVTAFRDGDGNILRFSHEILRSMTRSGGRNRCFGLAPS
jgi:hypothetical protein